MVAVVALRRLDADRQENAERAHVLHHRDRKVTAEVSTRPAPDASPEPRHPTHGHIDHPDTATARQTSTEAIMMISALEKLRNACSTGTTPVTIAALSASDAIRSIAEPVSDEQHEHAADDRKGFGPAKWSRLWSAQPRPLPAVREQVSLSPCSQATADSGCHGRRRSPASTLPVRLRPPAPSAGP